jgi:hypothetical protein
MATLFLDYEGGNDNYGGTSFALLAQGTNGRITTATFSAATANFPNDGSLINQYLSIFNGTIYAVYNITAWVSATSLTIAQISGGTALANQAVDRQYYIGGRWQTITNGATAVRIVPGDTLRLMGSPAPTSLGINGTWTSSILQGTTNVSAATNATPIVITTSAVHGLVTGDTVVITGAAGNTAANGTWEVTVTSTTQFSLTGSAGNGAWTSGGTVRKRTNTRVQLASAVTQTIASTGPRSAWTASANITATLNTTDYKEHQYSDSIDIAAAFTTGKAATTTTGTLDLSGYQQVSFWIKQTAGTNGAIGATSLVLCSDVNGNTAVNTINIPVLTGSSWIPVTVNTGAALGSSIRSIAFYVNTDNGAQTFLLSNIIACKAASAADSLSLTSLISKNRSDDTWYGIQSINGTRVMLDNAPASLPNNTRGYSHSSGTETITTWKRETIKTVLLTGTNPLFTVNESGIAGSLIYYEGGWDRTAMSTQNLETWFDGQNGLGYASQTLGNYTSFNKFSFVRYTSGPQYTGSFNIITNAHYNNNNLYGLYCQAVYSTIDTIFCSGCGNNAVFAFGGRGSNVNNLNVFGAGNVGLTNQAGGGPNVTIQNSTFRNNSSNGVNVGTTWGIVLKSCTAIENNGVGFGINNFNNGGNSACIQCTATNNSTYGFAGAANGSYLTNCTTTGNGVAGVVPSNGNFIYAKNCTFNEATAFGANPQTNARLYSQNDGNVSGNHKIYTDYGLIIADTVNRHTASGFSWKLSPTNIIRDAAYPLDFSLAKVACAANSLVTIKAWMYRDNAGLTMQLVCKGGQLAGVPNDVTSTVSTTGAWEEETITFTPTEQGVVEIFAYAYGGSTFNGWVDDMTISQA